MRHDGCGRWGALTAMGMILAGCGSATVDPAAGTAEERGLSAARMAVQPAPELRCSGSTLAVPGQYATIGAALAAAKSGDRISVAPGTYAECLTLVDGVSLEGRNATLDGSACTAAVVRGVGGIVKGATFRGFTILNAPTVAIYLEQVANVRVESVRVVRPGWSAIRAVQATSLSLQDVHAEGAGQQGILLYDKSTAWASRLDVSGSGYAGVVAWDSRLVLLRSTFRDNGGNGSIRISTGASAYLEGNDVSGRTSGVSVDNGNLEEGDPGAAPAEAWLVGNDLHDNPQYGLFVFGKGSVAHSRGDRFRANKSVGVYVDLAAFDARGAHVEDNEWGMLVAGWEAFCVDAACTDVRIVVAGAQARLRDSRVQGNHLAGIGVDPGGVADLEEVMVRGNGAGTSWPGAGGTAWREYTYQGITHQVNAPSLLRARETVFQGNGGAGVRARDGARLDLGSGHEGGENSFLGNGGGSIANLTPNPVSAERNWFGTTSAAAIQASIQDCQTNVAWGCVDFTPFLTHPE